MRIRFTPVALAVALIAAIPSYAALPLSFTVVAADGLSYPVGIAPHGSGLIVSQHYPSGLPKNLATISPTGAVAPFSELAGLPDEIALAQKSDGAPYWFNNTNPPGMPARVGVVSADGSRLFPHHRTLGGERDLCTAVAYDTTGLWGGGLFAITRHGHLWMQRPSGSFRLLADLGATVEGLDFIPNVAAAGPLAGAIVTGELDGGGRIVALTRPGGVLTLRAYRLPIADEVEHLAVVPASRNLYVVDYYQSEVLGVSAGALAGAGMVGKLLASTERSGLYHVAWTGAAFTATQIAMQPGGTFEDICWSKAGVGSVPIVP